MSMEIQVNHTPADHMPSLQHDAQSDDEIKLMDLLLVIARHNRFIVKLIVAAAVLAVVYALFQPNVYTAKTMILPPQQQSASASVLLGQLGGLAGMAGGAMGLKNPGDLYLGMLKSNRVVDALIQHFRLQEYYKSKTMDDARETVKASTVLTSGKDGFITIEYSDKNAKFAATMANAYADELDALVRAYAVKEASSRKQFYEKRLDEVRSALSQAELEMKLFQEQNRVFSLGTGGGVSLGASGTIPKAELEYVRIAREVKYREMLLGAMAQQVTTATIDAAKDSAIIQVLDKASIPEKKSKPQRALIVLLSMMLAFLVGTIWAFIREARERAGKNPEQVERMNLLRRYLVTGR